MTADAASRRQWRREALICLGIIVLFACLLHVEVIFGGRVYHMDDAADGYYPGHIAVQRAFAAGELPTWENGSWCGWPLIVDPYNGVFYPLNIVYYVIGAARGLGFAIWMHVVLGGAGMWLLLRRRKLDAQAALVGALAFALSSFFVVRIRHVIFVQMMGWLPWILVGVEGWLQSRRRRELLMVAGTTALALLAGALSIGHFAALAVAGYTVARVIAASRAEEEGRRRRRALIDIGLLGAAAIIGALVAAAQLVPTVAHLPHSPRSLGSDYAFASSYAWPSLKYLVTLVAPDFFGGEDRLRYVGERNHWELAGWYVGALAVALAPFALLGRRDDGASPPAKKGAPGRAELWVAAILVLLAIGLALGDAGPVHPFFYKYVPLYAALRCPARALLMAVLLVPILAAHGAAALLDRSISRSRVIAIIAASSFIIAGGIGAWLLYPRLPAPRPLPLAVELARRALAHLALVIGAGAAVLVLGLFQTISRRAAALLLALVIGGDLLATGRRYVQPQPADYPSGMERFAAVEWLRAHHDGARFVNDPRGPFRLHNVGMVLGLENASGYDSVAIWRYVDLLYLINNGRPYPEPRLKHDFAGIGVWNLASPLLNVMHVRWLLADAAPEGGPHGPRWVTRFVPQPPTGAPAAKYEPWWDARMKVFENTAVLPRAFVAYRAEVLPDDARLAARLASAGFDPGRVALLEAAPSLAVPAPSPGVEAPAPTPARILSRGRHHLDLEVDAAAPGILVVSEPHYPGWRATVDGAPADTLRADWAFRGVALSPGRHRVSFHYTSRPTRIGLLLSALGLALLGAFAFAGRRSRAGSRRGSTGAEVVQ